MTVSREQQVARAMLSLTDHLVTGDDVVDLLSEMALMAVRLVDVDACGVLLADDQRRLHVVAASSNAARTLELFQLQRDEGPCLECFRTERRVVVPDLAAARPTWPAFAEAAETLGFVSVHAFPLRLRDQVLGAVGLFSTREGALPVEDLELAEALGHVAGVALVAQRVTADQQQLTDQLQQALRSRVVIEQCKGVLAASDGPDLDMDRAYRVLRRYARDHNRGLAAVASAVVSRELPAAALLAHAVRPRVPRSRRQSEA